MSTANANISQPGPDFDKYGSAVLSSLRQKGETLDPENIEAEGERLAEMLVLDEDELVERATTIARHEVDNDVGDAEVIGNIYEGDS